MPAPLSATVIEDSSTVTVISGAIPCSSQASRALSISSLTATRGQSRRSKPHWSVSSFSETKSSSRLVLKAVR